MTLNPYRRSPIAKSEPRPPALIFPTPAARLKGRYRWAVYEPDGKTPILVDVLDRHGEIIARRHDAHGWMPNLITDHGMNYIGTSVTHGGLLGVSGSAGLRRTLRLGTGSAEPDVTDTALDNEVEINTGTGSTSYTKDTVGHVLRATVTTTHNVTMSADRNLTEFGYSAATSSGDISVNIRELFRDDLGSPITISLLSGKILTVTHQLIAELPWLENGQSGQVTIEEYDASNTLVDSVVYDITYGFVVQTNNTGSGAFDAWAPAGTPSQVSSLSPSWTFNRHDTPTPVSGVANDSTGPSPETYVGGSFERIKLRTSPVSVLNGVLGGITYGFGFGGGFVVKFDDPASFEKLNTHTLQHGFKSTWARG